MSTPGFFPTKFHAWTHAYASLHGQRHHDEYLDAKIEREKTRRVRFFPDGSLIAVERNQGWDEHEKTGAPRGEVRSFSAKSRKRFLMYVSSLQREKLPLFVTLTYPDWWPMEWQAWKEHLHEFSKRLLRRFPHAGAIWKLEPQQRGAPHFHLLLWGVPFLPHEWLANSWYEVVGTNDRDHLKAGTSVERARSFRGVMCYAGKKYLGKEVELPPGWENVGRFWGAIGRKNLPLSRVMDFKISVAAAKRLRRVMRKWLARHNGARFRTRHVVFFTQAHLQWLRVVEWAQGLGIVPLNLKAGERAEDHLLRTPF